MGSGHDSTSQNLLLFISWGTQIITRQLSLPISFILFLKCVQCFLNVKLCHFFIIILRYASMYIDNIQLYIDLIQKANADKV